MKKPSKEQCKGSQMVTNKQVMLYLNALSKPPLIQAKYTQERHEDTSKGFIVTKRRCLTTQKLQMTSPTPNICDLNMVNPKVCTKKLEHQQEVLAMYL